jgi:hypothetical protein
MTGQIEAVEIPAGDFEIIAEAAHLAGMGGEDCVRWEESPPVFEGREIIEAIGVNDEQWACGIGQSAEGFEDMEDRITGMRGLAETGTDEQGAIASEMLGENFGMLKAFIFSRREEDKGRFVHTGSINGQHSGGDGERDEASADAPGSSTGEIGRSGIRRRSGEEHRFAESAFIAIEWAFWQ